MNTRNMECNREEAIRAKEISEMKIRAGDFLAARRLALKAQRLFPGLENIAHLLTVCDVHCSAQNKIMDLDNWYGVLQVEQFADEATIKKQYRKLALVLHPDKNKLAGAEAAFKLIGEAYRFLSDQTKRPYYDIKLKSFSQSALSKSVPVQQKSCSAGSRRGPSHNVCQNSVDQTADKTFWTCCRYCGMKYKYLREYVNKVLRCQGCQNFFSAVDVGLEFVPPSFKEGSASNFYHCPSQGTSRTSMHHSRAKPSGYYQGFAGSGLTSMSAKNSDGRRVFVGLKKVEKDLGKSKDSVLFPKACRTDAESLSRQSMSKSAHVTGSVSVTAGTVGTEALKIGKRKRMEVVDESEESLEDESSENMDEIQDSGGSAVGKGKSGAEEMYRRKSSRLKQKISYAEDGSDEDFSSSPLKGTKKNMTSESNDQSNNTSNGKISDELPGSNEKNDISRTRREKAANDDKSQPDSASTSSENAPLDKNVINCPDPEFSDFEKDKKLACFAVNQVWAMYADDSRPRYYARSKKVISPGFELRITWLEPKSRNEKEQKWIDEGMPVGCGEFENGETENIKDIFMLSHQMHLPKRTSKGSCFVYPKGGEIWALFKDWDINWSSFTEKHKPPFQYEFVQVMCDFSEKQGISARYLSKVKGFVCLFEPTAKNGAATINVPPRDMYRFSHKVPSSKMTGKERAGVPEGSFELDPAALPEYFFQLDNEGGNVSTRKEA